MRHTQHSLVTRGCSSMVELLLPKQRARVRFPSSAPSPGSSAEERLPSKQLAGGSIPSLDAVTASPGCENRRTPGLSSRGSFLYLCLVDQLAAQP